MSAAYVSTLAGLRDCSPEQIIGGLTTAAADAGYARHWHTQTEAWHEEIWCLQRAAADTIERRAGAGRWGILLEYSIPRRERRIDAVVLAAGAIVVLEFKVGAVSADSAAAWQAEDYALDLRDFHEESQGRPIFPAVVATSNSGAESNAALTVTLASSVARVARIGSSGLAQLILNAAEYADALNFAVLDGKKWSESPYRPALSIIEVAEAIFAGHEVREIAHAAAENLTTTTDSIVTAIRNAQANFKRVACFVTGVPGAGKTLAGLALVHNPTLRDQGRPAGIFLSGNGPLVKIVREALVRDLRGRSLAPRDACRRVTTFIQNVHGFLGEYALKNPHRPPPEHVIVFDEAQRAWNANQMERKRGIAKSEPQMMLEVMERCPDWSVIVALVGGGQEIHNGEAGLEEWGRALAGRGDTWMVMASSDALEGSANMAGQRLFSSASVSPLMIQTDDSLRLHVSLRSWRSRAVTGWVDAVLGGDANLAKRMLSTDGEFPIVLTRDLNTARSWLRTRGHGATRGGIIGLVASSGALRSRPYGLELSSGFRRSYPFVEWFLGRGGDVRSSDSLEVAATEFECQGLELDWVGVCWGDDFTYDRQARTWSLRKFAGTRWRSVGQATRRYLINKYRVLLTRARRGMVIWVPAGDPQDPTRDPQRLNETAEFLVACGLRSE